MRPMLPKRQLTGGLALAQLALFACRGTPPNAEDYLDVGSSGSTGLGDGPTSTPGTLGTADDTGEPEGTGGGTGETGEPDPDPVCGNGIVENEEQCDDGGESATCNSDCSLWACGDGITNGTAAEECDDRGESLSCDDDCTAVQCGDSNINGVAGEECEGADLDGATCASEGFDGGVLGCDVGCLFDTTACYSCGDGATNPGELCDGMDLGGETCLGLGFDGGTLACDPVCGYDTSGCYGCGDGAVNPGEECDGADLAGSTCAAQGFLGGALACDAACSYDTTACFACDDGVQNGDETDIDCGNACGANCEPGEGCLAGADCVSFGCDAGTLLCNDLLSVEASPACSNFSGVPAVLDAAAAGGSGVYAHAWTPNDGTLSTPDQASTEASPAGQQTYTVTVDDGFAVAQDSVVVVNTTPLDLQSSCNVYGANSYAYQLGGTQTCATVNTSPGLHLCEGVALSNVRLRATLEIPSGGDDDSMGLVWGAQDESNFYSLAWRAGGICGPAGMVVKRVQGPSFAVVGANDVHCPNDTANSTYLLGPMETTTQPWIIGVAYDFTIDFTDLGSEVTVVRQSDGVVLANFVVADNTFTSGYFGGTTYSQQNACIGPLTAECL